MRLSTSTDQPQSRVRGEIIGLSPRYSCRPLPSPRTGRPGAFTPKPPGAAHADGDPGGTPMRALFEILLTVALFAALALIVAEVVGLP